MSSEEDTVIWQIWAISGDKKITVPLSLESFFTSKMGVSAGRRLYKDLLASVSQLGAGTVAVDLAEKHGPFVEYRSQS